MAAFGDSLTASFDAQTYGGRIESGYRLGTLASGLTPFAAVQALGFRTPNYAETDQTGGGFGLAFKGRTASDIRSEIGARVDHVFAVSANTSLALLARLGWAHDWVSDPTLVAAFQTLPGFGSFTVEGTKPVRDIGLVSTEAQLRLSDGVTLGTKFDGEFAPRSQGYAGTISLRRSW